MWWHTRILRNSLTRSSKSFKRSERGILSGSAKFSQVCILNHGQVSKWRWLRSEWYSSTQWLKTLHVSVGSSLTMILLLHLQIKHQYNCDIGHWRVFRATFSHPWEAHTTGLSCSGIANHLNTVNVSIPQNLYESTNPVVFCIELYPMD